MLASTAHNSVVIAKKPNPYQRYIKDQPSSVPTPEAVCYSHFCCVRLVMALFGMTDIILTRDEQATMQP